MKMTQTAKLFTGLGLMASLFWGCQDLLSQKDGSAKEPEAITADGSALRLSIKDDSTCREQWNMILDARAAGLADTAAEKSFLANCVKEIKPGKDKMPPAIPPHLQPDSASRCHWIVSQIEGGRNEMTVSYKRYCPEDCRKLEDKDRTRHVRLCRDSNGPGVDTTKPPRDTLKNPRDTIKNPRDTIKNPRDTIKNPRDSGECRAIKAKLAYVKPGEPGRAELEKMLLVRCNDTIWPPRDPLEDTCKMIRARIAGLDTTSKEFHNLLRILRERCDGVKPPIDTVKPPIDTVKPPRSDTAECLVLSQKLSLFKPGEPGRAELERLFKERCLDSLPKPPINDCEAIMKKLLSVPVGGPDYLVLKAMYGRECSVPRDTVVHPPITKDTLVHPPIIKDSIPVKPETPVVHCDELRAKLLKLDPASAHYKRLSLFIHGLCTGTKPAVK